MNPSHTSVQFTPGYTQFEVSLIQKGFCAVRDKQSSGQMFSQERVTHEAFSCGRVECYLYLELETGGPR
jgi:hypothetical protein